MKKLIDRIYNNYYKKQAEKYMKSIGIYKDFPHETYYYKYGVFNTQIRFDNNDVYISVYKSNETLGHLDRNVTINIRDYNNIEKEIEKLYKDILMERFDMDKINNSYEIGIPYSAIANVLFSVYHEKIKKKYLKSE